MRKLVNGVVDFHNRIRPEIKETFKTLALGQKPDVLFISCSDSRVAANIFASTDPGDVFVVRNVGNMVPPSDEVGQSQGDFSEIAAIEFALQNLGVKHIVVCGHSECGAMMAVSKGGKTPGLDHLESWLKHGSNLKNRVNTINKGLLKHYPAEPHNIYSQLNVLEQLDHLRGYPLIASAIEAGKLSLHGWWFEIAEAQVHTYVPDLGHFKVIDAKMGAELMDRLG